MTGQKELYDIFELIYPVGIIIELATNANPKDLFGIGEWEQIKDRFILAAGDSYTAGNTGGSGSTTLSIANMPSHNHKPQTERITSTDTYPTYMFTINRTTSSASTGRFKAASGSDFYVMAADPDAADYVSVDDISQTSGTSYVGNGEAFSNMPPYYVAYLWRRVS